MDLASRARPNRGLIESLSQANALDCFSEVRSKSVDQIMELWDETINRRSQQEKEANRLAKQKYTVISPLEQMMKNDDEFQGFTDIKSQKKTREPNKIRIKSSLDLFPDDLL
jgi:DNA polymerase III alpha subunit